MRHNQIFNNMGYARESLTVSHETWQGKCLENVIVYSARLRSFNIVPLDRNFYTATHKNNFIFIVLSQLRHHKHHKTHSPNNSTFGNWKIFNLVNICLLFGEIWCAEKYQYYCFMEYRKLHCVDGYYWFSNAANRSSYAERDKIRHCRRKEEATEAFDCASFSQCGKMIYLIWNVQ